MDAIREAGNALLDFLYPPVCYLCRRVGAFVCDDCVAAWPVVEPPTCSRCGGPSDGACRWCARGPRNLAGAAFACIFADNAREVVHLLKYHGKMRVAPAMAEAMALAAYRAAGFLRVGSIVPVPLFSARLRERGYNQCDWLCEELAPRLELPVSHWLTRTRDTGAQVGLTAAQRAENMRGAFAAEPEARGHHILLVDDVSTTGATASDAARALLAAGAASVRLLTFARDV